MMAVSVLLGTYGPLVGAFSGQGPGLLDLRASPAMPGQLGHGVRWTSYAGHRTLDMWLHILLLRWMSPFETKIKTDIPSVQQVDFWSFGLMLTILGLILVNVGQMFGQCWPSPGS